jgi:hypothetical protein
MVSPFRSHPIENGSQLARQGASDKIVRRVGETGMTKVDEQSSITKAADLSLP